MTIRVQPIRLLGQRGEEGAERGSGGAVAAACFGATLAALTLGEFLAPLQLVGGALVLVSVVLVQVRTAGAAAPAVRGSRLTSREVRSARKD